jgi:hypothetical protein
MTQHYLAGELSLRLARLQDVAVGQERECAVEQLRKEAETVPIPSLPSVLARTLMFGDALCWESLTRGDVAAFSAQAAICADLLEFGRSAGLLRDRSLI